LIYKLDTSGNYIVLYTFNGGDDGEWPGSLVLDSADNVYGTTAEGGGNGCEGLGCGLVFKLGKTGTFTVMHRFKGTDGESPKGVILLSGTIYGTAALGGASNAGVVFSIEQKSK
jgi:hypothetical protein